MFIYGINCTNFNYFLLLKTIETTIQLFKTKTNLYKWLKIQFKNE